MTFYFGTNVKMHHTPTESKTFVTSLQQHACPSDVQRFYIPPFTSLGGLADETHASDIWIGAQNMHQADAGEFTGEIAAPMLTALNVDMVLLGHAERRQLFGETDQLLAQKITTALRHGLRPLLCVGENAAQRDAGEQVSVIREQLNTALMHAGNGHAILLAYEPVWAIGESGRPATVDDVLQPLRFIRDWLDSRFGEVHVPLLYGGSVNPNNCGGYAAIDGVDGVFVGRAARTPEGFYTTLTAAYASWKNNR
ncbi:MAG: triose-phosphate isomerase [Chloroflexota bacterium]